MLHNNPIEFKGSAFSFIVLYIKNHAINIVKNAILKKIQEAPMFFENASVMLNVSYLTSSVSWNDMQKAIFSTGLNIIGICGHVDHILKNIITSNSIPIFSDKKFFLHDNYHFKKYNILNSSYLKSKIITNPVRSGQKIYADQSDLIIINNVSTGAELISAGNIHVYGIMRGRALAGAYGDTTRKIFCIKFFAEIVSISGEYMLIDQISPNLLGSGVCVSLKKNILHVNSFT